MINLFPSQSEFPSRLIFRKGRAESFSGEFSKQEKKIQDKREEELKASQDYDIDTGLQLDPTAEEIAAARKDIISEKEVEDRTQEIINKAQSSGLSSKYEKQVLEHLDKFIHQGTTELDAEFKTVDKKAEKKLQSIHAKTKQELTTFNEETPDIKLMYGLVRDKSKISKATSLTTYRRNSRYALEINKKLGWSKAYVIEVQKLLGVKTDGEMGPDTINALSKMLGLNNKVKWTKTETRYKGEEKSEEEKAVEQKGVEKAIEDGDVDEETAEEIVEAPEETPEVPIEVSDNVKRDARRLGKFLRSLKFGAGEIKQLTEDYTAQTHPRSFASIQQEYATFQARVDRLNPVPAQAKFLKHVQRAYLYALVSGNRKDALAAQNALDKSIRKEPEKYFAVQLASSQETIKAQQKSLKFAQAKLQDIQSTIRITSNRIIELTKGNRAWYEAFAENDHEQEIADLIDKRNALEEQMKPIQSEVDTQQRELDITQVKYQLLIYELMKGAGVREINLDRYIIDFDTQKGELADELGWTDEEISRKIANIESELAAAKKRMEKRIAESSDELSEFECDYYGGKHSEALKKSVESYSSNALLLDLVSGFEQKESLEAAITTEFQDEKRYELYQTLLLQNPKLDPLEFLKFYQQNPDATPEDFSVFQSPETAPKTIEQPTTSPKEKVDKLNASLRKLQAHQIYFYNTLAPSLRGLVMKNSDQAKAIQKLEALFKSMPVDARKGAYSDPETFQKCYDKIRREMLEVEGHLYELKTFAKEKYDGAKQPPPELVALARKHGYIPVLFSEKYDGSKASHWLIMKRDDEGNPIIKSPLAIGIKVEKERELSDLGLWQKQLHALQQLNGHEITVGAQYQRSTLDDQLVDASYTADKEQIEKLQDEKSRSQAEVLLAIETNPNLRTLRQKGRPIAEAANRLKYSVYATTGSRTTEAFVNDIKSASGSLMRRIREPGFTQALKAAKADIEALKVFTTGSATDPVERHIAKIITQIKQIELAQSQAAKFHEKVSTMMPDEFVTWLKTDGLVLFTAILAGILIITGVGAVAGIELGIVSTSLLMATGGLIGSEIGKAISGNVFDTGLKSNFEKWQDGEMPFEDLLRTYALEWSMSAASQTFFIGLGKALGPAIALGGEKNIFLFSNVCKHLMKMSPVVRGEFLNPSTALGRFGLEIFSEVWQEIAEQTAGYIYGPLGTFVTIMNTLDGRYTPIRFTKFVGRQRLGKHKIQHVREIEPGTDFDAEIDRQVQSGAYPNHKITRTQDSQGREVVILEYTQNFYGQDYVIQQVFRPQTASQGGKSKESLTDTTRRRTSESLQGARALMDEMAFLAFNPLPYAGNADIQVDAPAEEEAEKAPPASREQSPETTEALEDVRREIGTLQTLIRTEVVKQEDFDDVLESIHTLERTGYDASEIRRDVLALKAEWQKEVHLAEKAQAREASAALKNERNQSELVDSLVQTHQADVAEIKRRVDSGQDVSDAAVAVLDLELKRIEDEAAEYEELLSQATPHLSDRELDQKDAKVNYFKAYARKQKERIDQIRQKMDQLARKKLRGLIDKHQTEVSTARKKADRNEEFTEAEVTNLENDLAVIEQATEQYEESLRINRPHLDERTITDREFEISYFKAYVEKQREHIAALREKLKEQEQDRLEAQTEAAWQNPEMDQALAVVNQEKTESDIRHELSEIDSEVTAIARRDIDAAPITDGEIQAAETKLTELEKKVEEIDPAKEADSDRAEAFKSEISARIRELQGAVSGLRLLIPSNAVPEVVSGQPAEVASSRAANPAGSSTGKAKKARIKKVGKINRNTRSFEVRNWGELNTGDVITTQDANGEPSPGWAVIGFTTNGRVRVRANFDQALVKDISTVEVRNSNPGGVIDRTTVTAVGSRNPKYRSNGNEFGVGDKIHIFDTNEEYTITNINPSRGEDAITLINRDGETMMISPTEMATWNPNGPFEKGDVTTPGEYREKLPKGKPQSFDLNGKLTLVLGSSDAESAMLEVTSTPTGIAISSEGMEQPIMIPTGHSLDLGRAQLPDSPRQVSRKHLTISVQPDGQIILTDHSRYGTKVLPKPYETKLEAQDTYQYDVGDHIMLGASVRLRTYESEGEMFVDITHEGETFSIVRLTKGQSAIIGRSRLSRTTLDPATRNTISGKHIEVTYQGDGHFQITDLSSTNGTEVIENPRAASAPQPSLQVSEPLGQPLTKAFESRASDAEVSRLQSLAETPAGARQILGIPSELPLSQDMRFAVRILANSARYTASQGPLAKSGNSAFVDAVITAEAIINQEIDDAPRTSPKIKKMSLSDIGAYLSFYKTALSLTPWSQDSERKALQAMVNALYHVLSQRPSDFQSLMSDPTWSARHENLLNTLVELPYKVENEAELSDMRTKLLAKKYQVTEQEVKSMELRSFQAHVSKGKIIIPEGFSIRQLHSILQSLDLGFGSHVLETHPDNLRLVTEFYAYARFVGLPPFRNGDEVYGKDFIKYSIEAAHIQGLSAMRDMIDAFAAIGKHFHVGIQFGIPLYISHYTNGPAGLETLRGLTAALRSLEPDLIKIFDYDDNYGTPARAVIELIADLSQGPDADTQIEQFRTVLQALSAKLEKVDESKYPTLRETIISEVFQSLSSRGGPAIDIADFHIADIDVLTDIRFNDKARHQSDTMKAAYAIKNYYRRKPKPTKSFQDYMYGIVVGKRGKKNVTLPKGFFRPAVMAAIYNAANGDHETITIFATMLYEGRVEVFGKNKREAQKAIRDYFAQIDTLATALTVDAQNHGTDLSAEDADKVGVNRARLIHRIRENIEDPADQLRAIEAIAIAYKNTNNNAAILTKIAELDDAEISLDKITEITNAEQAKYLDTLLDGYEKKAELKTGLLALYENGEADLANSLLFQLTYLQQREYKEIGDYQNPDGERVRHDRKQETKDFMDAMLAITQNQEDFKAQRYSDRQYQAVVGSLPTGQQQSFRDIWENDYESDTSLGTVSITDDKNLLLHAGEFNCLALGKDNSGAISNIVLDGRIKVMELQTPSGRETAKMAILNSTNGPVLYLEFPTGNSLKASNTMKTFIGVAHDYAQQLGIPLVIDRDSAQSDKIDVIPADLEAQEADGVTYSASFDRAMDLDIRKPEWSGRAGSPKLAPGYFIQPNETSDFALTPIGARP